MSERALPVVRTITVTAALVAAVLAIGLPGVYFTIAYQYMRGSLDTEAEVDARYVSHLVAANPTMWVYEQVRLTELLDRRSSQGVPEARRLFDVTAQLVAESADPLAAPEVARRHPVYDARVPVAEVEVARSLRPLLYETGIVLACSLVGAALVFLTMRTLPLRAIERAEAARRRVEEHLAHAQRMESVGRLAGGVAHDFNNLLAVILSFARGLVEDLQGEPLEYAREIQRAGERGAALTRQLLSFSRKQAVHPEVLRLADVVADSTAMIRRLVGGDVVLDVHVPRDAGCIHTDRTQLEHTLVNLAANARDAMPDGGTLTIAGRSAEVATRGSEVDVAPGRYVVLTVSDSGVGMDAATRSRLFEPFFTTKPTGKGTGLGLSLVFSAVEQAGGRIDVASEVGAGTTFTIFYPRVDDPPDRAPDAPRAAVPRGSGEHVLVVDDEPQIRSAVRLLLTSGGYDVIEAASAEEALAAFRSRQNIQLVLTDVVMPGTSGVAFGRAIRALGSVPVLYMCGYSKELASSDDSIPPELFLQKPFDSETLLRRVHAAVHP